MLIKVHHIMLMETRDSKTNYEPVEAGRKEVYFNPDRIAWLEMPTGKMTYAILRVDVRELAISPEDGQRIIDHCSQPAASAPAAAALPKGSNTAIIGMTSDRTKRGDQFWRCATDIGFMVNVFKNDDPLKDTFGLFDTAGYAPEMLAMSYGDTINWLAHPVTVALIQNGSFWNVMKVHPRPDGAVPDADDEQPEESGDHE